LVQRLMQVLTVVATVVAVISVIIGVIARLAGALVAGLSPSAYLRFTDTCLLFAIAFALFVLVRGKSQGK
jgi:hypothetical protein